VSGPHKVLEQFNLANDRSSYGPAHDALLDDGRDHAAAELTHAVRPAAPPWAVGELTEAYRAAHAVAEHLEYSEEVWTRERAAKLTGYDAAKARDIFSRTPEAKVVVISTDAPTSLGLRLIRGKELSSQVGKAAVFYRKSSGGRWGRSSQQVFVAVPK
jgi:hypothetical protein